MGNLVNGGGNVTVGFLTTSGTSTANAVVSNTNAQVSLLTINNSTTDTYSGALGGTGANQNNIAIRKAGNRHVGPDRFAALLNRTNNIYFGGTIIGGGTLSLGAPGAIGTTGDIVFSNGGTLQFTSSNTTDYSSRIGVTNTGVSGGQHLGHQHRHQRPERHLRQRAGCAQLRAA